MTWDELTALLSELARQLDARVNVADAEEALEVVSLHLPPAAWFSARKFAPALYIGVYHGEEKHRVDTEQIPLAELTPEFVRERVQTAFVEVVRSAVHAHGFEDCFARTAQPSQRDVEGAG